MPGQEVFVARRQHGIGSPGGVRLTSSAAVPSPPTPTRARSRPWACQASAWRATWSRSVKTSAISPASWSRATRRSIWGRAAADPAFGLTDTTT